MGGQITFDRVGRWSVALHLNVRHGLDQTNSKPFLLIEFEKALFYLTAFNYGNWTHQRKRLRKRSALISGIIEAYTNSNAHGTLAGDAWRLLWLMLLGRRFEYSSSSPHSKTSDTSSREISGIDGASNQTMCACGACEICCLFSGCAYCEEDEILKLVTLCCVRAFAGAGSRAGKEAAEQGKYECDFKSNIIHHSVVGCDEDLQS